VQGVRGTKVRVGDFKGQKRLEGKALETERDGERLFKIRALDGDNVRAEDVRGRKC